MYQHVMEVYAQSQKENLVLLK